jgi:hypothetical protein
MKPPPILCLALALAGASCSSAHDRNTSAFGGSSSDSGSLRKNELRDSPAVSSSATLPSLTGSGYGSANRYDNSLGGSSVAIPRTPSVSGGMEASPQAGVVTGDRVWP